MSYDTPRHHKWAAFAPDSLAFCLCRLIHSLASHSSMWFINVTC
jgi:hypothetical protein